MNDNGVYHLSEKLIKKGYISDSKGIYKKYSNNYYLRIARDNADKEKPLTYSWVKNIGKESFKFIEKNKMYNKLIPELNMNNKGDITITRSISNLGIILELPRHENSFKDFVKEYYQDIIIDDGLDVLKNNDFVIPENIKNNYQQISKKENTNPKVKEMINKIYKEGTIAKVMAKSISKIYAVNIDECEKDCKFFLSEYIDGINAVHIAINESKGKGKSSYLKAITSCLPNESVIYPSRISPKVLYYYLDNKPENFTIIIDDNNLDNLWDLIKVLSDNSINPNEREYWVLDNGRNVQRIKLNGKYHVIIANAKGIDDEETLDRFISLTDFDKIKVDDDEVKNKIKISDKIIFNSISDIKNSMLYKNQNKIIQGVIRKIKDDNIKIFNPYTFLLKKNIKLGDNRLIEKICELSKVNTYLNPNNKVVTLRNSIKIKVGCKKDVTDCFDGFDFEDQANKLTKDQRAILDYLKEMNITDIEEHILDIANSIDKDMQYDDYETLIDFSEGSGAGYLKQKIKEGLEPLQVKGIIKGADIGEKQVRTALITNDNNNKLSLVESGLVNEKEVRFWYDFSIYYASNTDDSKKKIENYLDDDITEYDKELKDALNFLTNLGISSEEYKMVSDCFE